MKTLREDIDLGEAFPHDRFEGETGKLVQGRYQNGRIALRYHDEMGQPVATITTNIPTQPLDEGEVIVKNWTENEGILDYLVDEEILSEPDRHVRTGHVEAPVCDVLIEE